MFSYLKDTLLSWLCLFIPFKQQIKKEYVSLKKKTKQQQHNGVRLKKKKTHITNMISVKVACTNLLDLKYPKANGHLGQFYR